MLLRLKQRKSFTKGQIGTQVTLTIVAQDGVVFVASPVTEPELEKMLREAVTDIEIDKEMWELGVDLLKAKHSAEVDTAINIRGQLKSDMESVDKELGTLLKLRMNEEITADEYAGQKRLLIDRRLKLKEKVEDSEETSMTWLELAENFFETAYRARTVMEGRDLEAKRELVKTVGWNLILKQENLRFSFKQPYDVLLQPAMRSDVQALVNFVGNYFSSPDAYAYSIFLETCET